MDYTWGQRCSCGRLVEDTNGFDTCAHCDTPCPHHEDGQCPPCRSILRHMEADKQEFSGRPHPTSEQLHDTARPVPEPIGAVGRCDSCGGRTYVTDTGPWCPRAFCQADAAPEA